MTATFNPFDFRPCIKSLLETDLYKFTMLQAMLHLMPANTAEYKFLCRNQPEYPLAELKAEVEQQLDWLCDLRFSEEELAYLGGLRFMKADFIDFLRIFQLQRRYLTVSTEGDTLSIVAKGPQIHVMFFEIFVLAIVNEIYFRGFDQARAIEEARIRLDEKIQMVKDHMSVQAAKNNPFEFFDFGIRRRFSGEWQEEVVATLASKLSECFKGTSNVYLAKKHALTPIGTQAHEWFQTFQAMPVQLKDFQKAALDAWAREYRGDLGVALTDVVGMDAFLNDCDLLFTKCFDGFRHDSGDPIVWGEKAIAHFQKMRVSPQSKRLVFSDGLDLPTAFELYDHFADRVQTGFGIGTNLMNDTGNRPLNIVMKLTECNGQPTAKLSDSPGKTLCSDEKFLAYLRQVFKVAA